MNPIREYYNQIIDGEIVVSDRVRRVYKHLVDKLENPSQYIYDKDRAEVAIDFIELFCKHSKGKWAGKPVILLQHYLDLLIKILKQENIKNLY